MVSTAFGPGAGPFAQRPTQPSPLPIRWSYLQRFYPPVDHGNLPARVRARVVLIRREGTPVQRPDTALIGLRLLSDVTRDRCTCRLEMRINLGAHTWMPFGWPGIRLSGYQGIRVSGEMAGYLAARRRFVVMQFVQCSRHRRPADIDRGPTRGNRRVWLGSCA